MPTDRLSSTGWRDYIRVLDNFVGERYSSVSEVIRCAIKDFIIKETEFVKIIERLDDGKKLLVDGKVYFKK